MSTIPEKQTIAVDRIQLETLIGMGKINSLEALRLSPELTQIAAVMKAKECETSEIQAAVGTLELDAADLIPLCLLARELGWMTDTINNLYPAMYKVSAMLSARGRGES